MSSIRPAVEWIQANGTALENARLAYLLAGIPPSEQQIMALFSGQRPDGGFAPFWAPDYSSVDAVCFRLAQAEQLGIPGAHPAVQAAVRFLVTRQAQDGSWEEDPTAAGAAPPWAAPGEFAAKLYLTANCGFWAAFFGSGSASAAAAWLENQLDAGGNLPSFEQTIWLAAGLFALLKWRVPAAGRMAALQDRVDDMDASAAAWMAHTLMAAGIAPVHPLIRSAAARLEALQEKDGHWSSADGPAFAAHAHTTLEALGVLVTSGAWALPDEPTLAAGIPGAALYQSVDFSVRVLSAADQPALQALIETCADFNLLVTGLPPGPTDGAQLLQDVPPAKGIEDKLLMGILTPDNRIMGVLDAVRSYPRDEIWWIGLLLLDPAERGKGVGQKVVRWFEHTAGASGAFEIRLGVVEENLPGLRFWNQCGYRELERRPPHRFGEKDQGVIVLAKKLPE